ncbi:MAG: CsbD family protein [Acidiferrobacter sp.]
MNNDQMQGRWVQIRGEAKRRWAKLTDDDLMEVEGNYDKLLGKIQERHGATRESIKKWIDSLGA